MKKAFSSKPGGKTLGVRDRIIAALPKLPERAATLIADGYRFAVDLKRPHGLRVFKPKTNTPRPGVADNYELTLWFDEQDCKYRYTCTCFHFVVMARDFDDEPECKHGIAAIAFHKEQLANYEAAKAVVAWVEHIEGPARLRAAAPPTGRQLREPLQPDYLHRLTTENHFGIAPGQPALWLGNGGGNG